MTIFNIIPNIQIGDVVIHVRKGLSRDLSAIGIVIKIQKKNSF
jgi:hypothetical protein